ncbi:hypothetical protein OS493_016080 [Desmophyllum pertusum]|uniref:UspA domain-containing protein n=1 Tax=Desmophyllum pertusum TaxID=174260 RepID=A0A9X0A1K4_9CNID|nr:hypothetical protein OS493_016080 [Desmophyllum pertusum]
MQLLWIRANTAKKAFDWFMANVFHEGDRLLVIHSHELQLPALPHMIATDEWKQQVIAHENIIKELQKRYEHKCKALKLSAKIIIENGPPGHEICKVAKKEGLPYCCRQPWCRNRSSHHIRKCE